MKAICIVMAILLCFSCFLSAGGMERVEFTEVISLAEGLDFDTDAMVNEMSLALDVLYYNFSEVKSAFTDFDGNIVTFIEKFGNILLVFKNIVQIIELTLFHFTLFPLKIILIVLYFCGVEPEYLTTIYVTYMAIGELNIMPEISNTPVQ